ncbi:DUF4870 domain-containing protein [Hazenella coriacea]|uniref:Tic20 family protein n=1 Tax=Hazenella coriacea TaxID=1179467 RepID=A0A4R3L563_9BACL|nr:DUF4870 domain-containing protein [Hazenella coriacea]TCS94931.1 hypothetical protein EDD58_103356 [Hazenella coriacea]
MVTTKEKGLSILCHGSGIFFPMIVSLSILLLYKKSPFIRLHAREALIFQLAFHLTLYASFLTLHIYIGFILVPVLLLYGTIVILIAIIKVWEGQSFHYPFTSRWAKKL